VNTAFSLYEILPTAPLITIVDVGASPGGTPEPYEKLVAEGRARVFAFEPDPEEHRKLLAHATSGRTVLADFVGDGNSGTYYETTQAQTGSLFEPNTPLLAKFSNLAEKVRTVGTHPVQTHRLDSFSEIPDIDFLKLDVQGAELAVLRGAEEKLQGCVLVQTEVEFVALYKEQPLFADIDTHLRAAGFAFHTFVGFGNRCFRPMMFKRNPNAGMRQMLWADAVYVRDFMALEKISNSKLMRLAILLHDTLASFDLCTVVLQELDRRGGGEIAGAYLRHLTSRPNSP